MSPFEACHAEARALQGSTNTDQPVIDSVLIAANYSVVSYTFQASVAAVTYTVYGANRADFGDEIAISGATASVAANARTSWTQADAPFAYYRIKIRSTVADTPGVMSIAGNAKA